MFTIAELKKLDYRELMLWQREAHLKRLEDSLNLLSLMRVSQAENESYRNVINEFKTKIAEIRVGEKETILENWASLKKTG